jgi:hypothetical protein
MNNVSNASEIVMNETESRMLRLRDLNAGYVDQMVAMKSDITGLNNSRSTSLRQVCADEQSSISIRTSGRNGKKRLIPLGSIRSSTLLLIRSLWMVCLTLTAVADSLAKAEVEKQQAEVSEMKKAKEEADEEK